LVRLKFGNAGMLKITLAPQLLEPPTCCTRLSVSNRLASDPRLDGKRSTIKQRSQTSFRLPLVASIHRSTSRSVRVSCRCHPPRRFPLLRRQQRIVMHYDLAVPVRKWPAILREFTGIDGRQSALTRDARKKSEGVVVANA
jgi:hypothetical protein